MTQPPQLDGALQELGHHLDRADLVTVGLEQTRATSLWNGAVLSVPAAVARCHSVADVQLVARVAQTYGLPLCVRGGGHDWSGSAFREGALVADLAALRQLTVEGTTATIGGGVTATALTTAAERVGLVAVTGAVGSIGMAGLTLGGGYGPLTGVAGLAADNLLAAQVVLADGRVVNTDRDQEPELFWALRGGGGNFGVVTQMTVKLHRISTVLAGTLIFPWTQARSVFLGCSDLQGESPDNLTTAFGVLSGPDGGPVAYVAPTWAGDAHAGAEWIDRIERLGEPLVSQVSTIPYSAVLAASDNLFPDGDHYEIQTRSFTEVSGAVADTLVSAGETRTSSRSVISFHDFHGAAERVPSDATAFGMRQRHLATLILAAWPAEDTRGDHHRAWARDTSKALAVHALPGGYPNYLGTDELQQADAAYGTNGERLTAAKHRYDPINVFSSIPLPGNTEGAHRRPTPPTTRT